MAALPLLVVICHLASFSQGQSPFLVNSFQPPIGGFPHFPQPFRSTAIMLTSIPHHLAQNNQTAAKTSRRRATHSPHCARRSIPHKATSPQRQACQNRRPPLSCRTRSTHNSRFDPASALHGVAGLGRSCRVCYAHRFDSLEQKSGAPPVILPARLSSCRRALRQRDRESLRFAVAHHNHLHLCARLQLGNRMA